MGEILTELNFSPVQCQKAIEKVKQVKAENPDFLSSKSLKKEKNADEYESDESLLIYFFWIPILVFAPLSILCTAFLQSLLDLQLFLPLLESTTVQSIQQWISNSISILLQSMYLVLSPIYLLGALLTKNKLENVAKISVSVVLIWLILGFWDFGILGFLCSIFVNILYSRPIPK